MVYDAINSRLGICPYVCPRGTPGPIANGANEDKYRHDTQVRYVTSCHVCCIREFSLRENSLYAKCRCKTNGLLSPASGPAGDRFLKDGQATEERAMHSRVTMHNAIRTKIRIQGVPLVKR